MAAKRKLIIIDEDVGMSNQSSIGSDASDERLADIEAAIEALKEDMAPRTKTTKLRQRIRELERTVGDLSEAVSGFVDMINKHDNTLAADYEDVECRVKTIEERLAEKEYERPAKRRRIDRRDVLIDRLFHRVDALEAKLRVLDTYGEHSSRCKECALGSSSNDSEQERSPEVSEEADDV